MSGRWTDGTYVITPVGKRVIVERWATVTSTVLTALGERTVTSRGLVPFPPVRTIPQLAELTDLADLEEI